MKRWLLRPGPAATTVGQLAAFAGGVHVALAPHHFSESTLYGWLFLIDGAALLLGGGVLMLSGHVRAWRAAGTAAAATALAYLISRTAGLPGLHPEVWDLKGIFTTALEGIVAITALVAGWAGDKPEPPEQDPAWLLALARSR
ncbi:MAG: hypothetical protein ACRDJ1_03440 [Actinomycetota bacterium]